MTGVDQNVADWSRAGARNVAGVTYQVAVTAYLWVLSRTGDLPFVRVIPEGTDDIDCEQADGSRLFVQAKERGAGRGALGAPEIAKILAAGSTGRRRHATLAVATNAVLPERLSFTGWGSPVSETDGDRLVHHLRHTHNASDIPGLLGRSRIVRIPWSVERLAIPRLAESFQIQRGVAALVVARLLQRTSQVASAQRHRAPEQALSLTPGAIDVVVQRVLEVVDPAALDLALRMGIAEPIDFTVTSATTLDRFLAGLDVNPGHIAANLDVPRPRETRAIEQSLRDSGYALVVGPSGAGKSCLLWRSAADLSGRCRTVRVRLLRREHVPTLVQWIRLLEPSVDTPVLICADDLGTGSMAGWVEAAHRLREIPGALLLGAARWEHFVPSLAAGTADIVEPHLDAELARSIAAALERRGVATQLDPDEALAGAGGLLMEYLSLLVSGGRLEQVVAAQVHERLAADRATERDLMRVTSTGHVAGLGVPSSALPHLLHHPDDLHHALEVLNREHLITLEDGRLWSGLHAARSVVVDRELHALPPPRRQATLLRLLPHVDADDRAQLLRHIAIRHPDALADAGRTAAELVAGMTAPDEVAQMIDAVLEADAVAHAAACLGALRAVLRDTVDPRNALLFAYSHRFLGVEFSPDLLDVRVEAALLPDPDRAGSRQLVGVLESERIRALLASAATAEAVRLVEAARHVGHIEPADARAIWEGVAPGSFSESGRLLAGLRRLLPDWTATEEVFGSREKRLEQFLELHPTALGGALEELPRKITAQVIVPIPTDVTPNEQAVACAQALLDWLPEISDTDVRTFLLDLEPIVEANGYEPHRKTIPRSNLPPVAESRQNQVFFRAATRLTEASSWTARLRAQAAIAQGLVVLLGEAPIRVMKRTDTARHRRGWRGNLREVEVAAAALSAPPGVADSGRPTTDLVGRALNDVVGGLVQLFGALDGPASELRFPGSALRAALPRLADARGEGWPRLKSLADPLPLELDREVALVSDLLIAIAESGTLPRVPGAGPRGWSALAAEYVEQRRQRTLDDEESLLRSAFESHGAMLHRVSRADTQSALLVTDRWLIECDAAFEDVLAALEELADGHRHQLGFRLFALHEEAVAGDPTRWTRMLMLGAPTIFPVSVDDAVELGVAAGLETPTPGEAWRIVQRVRDLLVEASRWSLIDNARTQQSRRALHVATTAQLLGDVRALVRELDGEPRRASQGLLDWCSEPSNLLVIGPYLTQLERGVNPVELPEVLVDFLRMLHNTRLGLLDCVCGPTL